MSIDPISIANLVIGTVAMVAACAAAYFAWKAPTKEDLARVERNTAITSDHLKAQAMQAELARKASRVSIAVQARGIAADSLLIRLTLQDPSVSLTHIDLYNEAQSLFGSFPCERVGELEFAAKITAPAMGKWFRGGTPVQLASRVRLVMQVSMLLQGVAASRQMAVMVYGVQLQDRGPTEAGWIIEGEV